MQVSPAGEEVVLTMKRYKFQALLTLDRAGDSEPAVVPPGQIRRMVVRGQAALRAAGRPG
jgi:hypothetical protein